MRERENAGLEERLYDEAAHGFAEASVTPSEFVRYVQQQRPSRPLKPTPRSIAELVTIGKGRGLNRTQCHSRCGY